MQRGKLSEKVTVQRATKTQTAIGGDTVTWSTIATYWCDPVFLPGQEIESAGQKWAVNRWRIRTQYNPSVTLRAEDRLAWGSRTLNITDVQESRRRGEVIIYAQEFRD